jgi:hypothetical protein
MNRLYTILVDGAYMMDYLSIIEVKLKAGLNVDGDRHFEHAYNQLGLDSLEKIVSSDEYITLRKANEDLFIAIESVRNQDGKIDVKEFDRLNQVRHECKKALQKKFFEGDLTEIKT